MFYIHQTACITPQTNLVNTSFETLKVFENNTLNVTETKYENIPPAVLRRMGKAVRLGMGVAMPFLNSDKTFDGIVIGTANGGMEDCIKFLNQIMEYEEGTLTPTNFVQSTSNAIAAQLAFYSKNKGYNITHVHRGFAFEMALIDIQMLLMENKSANYLVAGVDEMSTYNYNIDYLNGWYKNESIASDTLYNNNSIGTIAGEGAIMFEVNNDPEGAKAKFIDIATIHTENLEEVGEFIQSFLDKNHCQNTDIDLLLSGENGDSRFLPYFEIAAQKLTENTPIARFKHMVGEYQTAASSALWLASAIIHQQHIPQHMLKNETSISSIHKILIYNNYQGLQHSVMLVGICEM